MRRVGKGISGVETPLFEVMIVAQQANDIADEVAAGVDVDDVPADVEPTLPSPTSTTQPPPPSQELPSTSQVMPTPPLTPIIKPSSPPQQQPSQRTHDTEISLDLLHTLLETCATLTRKVEALEQDKVAQVFKIIKLKQRVKKLERKNKLKVSGLRRLRKDVVDDKVEKNADVQERATELKKVVKVVTTTKLITEVVTAAATITAATTPITAALNKGKGIMVQEPKPLKKKAQIEQDEAYARELEAELNKNINWDDVIEQVKRKEKIMYFNSNVVFLEKTKEQLEEEESRELKRTSESLKEKALKKQKLDEEVDELKKHIQIVPNNDDDVYTEATPLALKVPVVDYKIYTENNKPYYKIIRVNGTYQLFLSLLSLLRNFDREYLEMLWKIVQERFASSKPKNFSDDFLLTTLTYMFPKPDVQAKVWKN
nr:hypothetical protein [Tanacetum cinerariifolium]